MPHTAHWYEIAEGPRLRQGDILRALPLLYFDDELLRIAGGIADAAARGSAEGLEVPVKCIAGDWILLDASCDIDQADGRTAGLSQVLIARVVPAEPQFLQANGEKETRERREALRQGLAPSKFLLAECSAIDPAFPLSYVEYRQRFTVPHAYATAAAQRSGRRLRLKHPWREKFGNWVGSAISRVGPEDEALIPPFVQRLHQAQQLRAVEALTRET